MGWAKYEEDNFDAFYERMELKEQKSNNDVEQSD